MRTAIFGGIVAVMAAYAYFGIFRAEQKEQEVQEREAKITHVSVNDLARLTFEKSGERRVYAKEGGVWRILEPIQDLADESTLRNALTSVLTGQREELVGEKGSFDRATFGLEEPEAKLILETESGKQEELWIGSRKTYDGSHYVLKTADDSLVVMPFTWLTNLDKPVFELREKKVWRSQERPLKTVRFESGAEKWELVQTEGAWRLSGGPDWPISEERVNTYIRHLKDMRFAGFVAESKEPAELRKYSLQRPEFKVTLGYSEGEASGGQEEFLIGRDAKDKEVYVTSTSLHVIGRLFAKSASDLSVKSDSFYDLKQPFAVNMDDVTAISLKANGSVELAREEGRWVLRSQVASDMDLDPVQLQIVLDKVESLQAREFSAPGRWKGAFDKGSLRLMGSDDKVLLDLSWGTEATWPGSSGDQKIKMIPARLAGDERVFWLPTSEMEVIGQSLLKKKSTEAPPTARDAEDPSTQKDSQGGRG